MLMYQDVEDDLIEKFPDLYRRKGDILIYQNGKESPIYVVAIQVKVSNWNS
jgi:hypothetical protein